MTTENQHRDLEEEIRRKQEELEALRNLLKEDDSATRNFPKSPWGETSDSKSNNMPTFENPPPPPRKKNDD